MNSKFPYKYFLEFIGTALLVLIGLSMLFLCSERAPMSHLIPDEGVEADNRVPLQINWCNHISP
jgi:hypothetical protein